MILVIDNYDSFTWNLVHYLMELGARVEVVRNDAISAGQALSSGAEAFLISPGPKTPDHAGVSLDLVAACADARRRFPLASGGRGASISCQTVRPRGQAAAGVAAGGRRFATAATRRGLGSRQAGCSGGACGFS